MQSLMVKEKRALKSRNRNQYVTDLNKIGAETLPKRSSCSILSRIFHVLIETPLHKLCRLTIPAAEKEKWHRGFMMVTPTFGYVFILLATNIIDVDNWVQ